MQEGLTSAEAKQKLSEHGANVLPEKPPPSDFKIFISQFKNPLVYVLLGAAVVTFFLKHVSDTLIILVAVFINTILGFIQERRAKKALYELKKLIHPEVKVVRDGKTQVVAAEDLVPGDIVILDQGTKIPADGELTSANRFFVTEAILTGESLPVTKDAGDEVFMGTVVSGGRGRMKITKTGKDTKMGAIALSIQEPEDDTPLGKQLKNFSKQLSYLVLGLTLIVFVVGFLLGQNITDIFVTSVALSVSAIPEGLLVSLTVVLAIGMSRILKRKGLVRNLVSAETLGGVTTICVDKTGTLTKGEMRVVEFSGNDEDAALQLIVANDLDDPMLVSSYDWAKSKIGDAERLMEKHKRVDSIPFSSENKYFASLNSSGNRHNMLFVNGAPEEILKMSSLSSSEKKKIMAEISSVSKEGKRVIALGRKKEKKTKKKISEKDLTGLEFLGFLTLSDPVRKDVSNVLETTKKAGINLIVITGDYVDTAKAVLLELGVEVSPSDVHVGSELKKLKEEDLKKKLRDHSTVKLFARTDPEQKLKIVKALRDNGEVVAMTGDGVNDAPALKEADIGIVVGEATDVARETSDLVLLDSSFETIVSAIEEGRGIFDNLRKVILFLMSDSFEEIVAVMGSIIVAAFLVPGLPLPVTAAQILWINLVSDGFPNLALTVDPKTKNIMERPPRDPREPLVNTWMKGLIALVSFFGGAVALILFIYFYNTTGNLVLARSIAFATLGVNSSIYIFSVKNLTSPFWAENPLNNNWLNLAVAASFLVQFLPFIVPSFHRFFSVTHLSFSNLVVIFLAGVLMFIMIEVSKAVFRRHSTWFQH